jgi:hypothetical protein
LVDHALAISGLLVNREALGYFVPLLKADGPELIAGHAIRFDGMTTSE